MDNPFLRKRRKGILPGATEDYSPEEQSNLLDSIKSTSLSGLNYAGELLDKHTGSRALRGVLGGKPRELLSILPGSDMLGITDPKDITYGKDLLKWDDPNSVADDVAGFAVDFALDPTWLVGGGAVGAGGKALKAAGLTGKVAKLASAAKTGSRVTKLTKTAREVLEAGTKNKLGELAAGVKEVAPGLNLFPKEWEDFSRAATKKGQDPLKILDEPLQTSLASIRLPFMDEPLLKIGTGNKSLAAARMLDAAGKPITAPLQGWQTKKSDDAEKSFRAAMRQATPSTVTDDMIDRNMDVWRSYAEGYHGQTLGEFVRQKKIKFDDGNFAFGQPGKTLYQDGPLWESKFIKTVEKNTNKAFGLDELKAMAKKAGVKDEEIEWAELDSLFPDKTQRVKKQQVMEHLKQSIDPDVLIEQVDDAKMRGNAQGGTVTPGGVPGTVRTWALRSPKVGAGATTGHLGDITDPIGYVRVQDWQLPNGKKALVVENIQSDLHQAGIEQGYLDKSTLRAMQARIDEAHSQYLELLKKHGGDPAEAKELQKYAESLREGDRFDSKMQQISDKLWNLDESHPDLKAASNEYAWLRDRLWQKTREQVPSLPFKGNRWVEKLLQKVAKEAVAGGYDEILITPGATQAERWGQDWLRKFYDETVQDAAKRALGSRGSKAARRPALALKAQAMQELEKGLWGDWAQFTLGDTWEMYGPSGWRKPYNIGPPSADGTRKLWTEGGDVIMSSRNLQELKDAGVKHAIESAERNLSGSSFTSIPVSAIKKGPYSLFQGGAANPKAATSFLPSGEIVLQTFKSANFSSHVHEFGHVASRFLTDSDRAIVNKFLGKADDALWDTWTTADHEKFAEGLEKFMLSGAKPKGALEQVWQKIQAWMQSIYNSVAKKGQLADVSPAVNEVYQRMMQGRPDHLKGYSQAGTAGARTLKIAGKLDKATDWMRYGNSVGMGLGKLFDASSLGADTPTVQKLGKEILPAVAEARQHALESSGQSLREMGERGLLDPQSGRALRRQAEGFEQMTPDTASILNRERAAADAEFEGAQHVGAAGERLGDPMMPQWAPRGAFIKKHGRAIKKALRSVLGKDAPTDWKRADFLKKIVRGTDELEHEILRNPSLVGPGKWPTLKLQVMDLENNYKHLLPLHSPDEIKQLAKFLRRLPDNIIDDGFYKNVVESYQDYKVGVAEKRVRAEKTLESIAENLGAHPNGVEVRQVLKALKLRRGGLSNTQLKALGTEIANGTKTTGDLARELERMQKGAYARLSEHRGIVNPTGALAQQLRAGTIAPADAIKEATKWQSEINKLTLPKELAADYSKAQEFFKSPKAVSSIVRALDSYTNLFKAGVLTWPARFVRDLASGQSQNWMMGVFRPKTVEGVRKLLSGGEMSLEELKQIPVVMELLAKENLPATAENANKMLRSHLYAMELIGERVSDVSQIGGPKAVQGVQELHQSIPGVKPLNLKAALGEATNKKAWLDYGKGVRPHKPNTWGVRGVSGAEDTTMPLLKAGNVTGTFVDALNRVPAYLEFLKKGMSPAEAKAQTMAAHVEYGNRALTPFEQKVMTRAAPFYRFTKGSAKKTIDELLKNPHGRMAQIVRGGQRTQSQSEEGQFVPEHLQRTLALPIPKNKLTDVLGLSGPEGNTRYLTGLGLMHEDPLSLIQPAGDLYHTAKATGQSLLGRMNPVIKAPLEIAFGKQAFSGRDMEDLDPNLGRIGANVMGKEDPYRTPILLEHALANSPASRALSTLRTVTDTRPDTLVKKILNLSSGIRLTDQDNEKTKNLAIRKMLEESLRGAPGVHNYQHLYAPDKSKLTEEEKALVELYEAFSKASAKKARERKKAG